MGLCRLTINPGPTEVVLVRHARSVPPTADGPDDFTRSLTPEGMRQADELVTALSEPRPAAVWSSPDRRAIQTIRPTAQALGLPVHTDGELREWDDGLAYTDDWEQHYAESWADSSYARPGGESLEQLRARAVDAVRALANRNRGHVFLVAARLPDLVRDHHCRTRLNEVRHTRAPERLTLAGPSRGGGDSPARARSLITVRAAPNGRK